MKKKINKYNDFSKDYLEWCKEYFAYKVHIFELDNAKVIKAEESIRSKKITSIELLHDEIRKISNMGIRQLSNSFIGIKKYYYYFTKNNIDSFDDIDEILINNFLNKDCPNDKLQFGTRNNYKVNIVALLKFIEKETNQSLNINYKDIKVIQNSESKKNNSKLVDWMDKKMIQRANKELLKMNFTNELEKCRNILIFRILLFSGIERKELQNLKEDNFIFKNGEMILRIFATPSRKEREIDLPKAHLIRYFNKYRELKKDTELFFYDEKNNNKPIHQDLVTEIVRDILVFAKINVRDKNPTMLRKTFAIYLNTEKNPETGLTMPEKNIQELMGIKNISQLKEILKLHSVEVMTASKHFLDLKI
jgi:integrase